MMAKRSSYLVYIQRIKVITLQLQYIKSDLKETIDFLAQIKDYILAETVPSVQLISLNEIIRYHTEDLIVARENMVKAEEEADTETLGNRIERRIETIMKKGEENWRQLTLYFKEIEEKKEFKVELGGNYTKKYTH